MKKNVLIVLLISTIIGNAQDFKFGKISKKELEEKVHPLDKEAHAAVLYKSEKITYKYRDEDGFSQVKEVVERIKIYDKQGFNWATRKVKLYDKNNKNRESFKGLSAYTYILEDGKIKKTKIKRESVFQEKNNKFWTTKKFTMPSVKEGCVIEYKYQINSPFIRINDIDLQYTIPINTLAFSATIPEYFIFKKFTNPKADFLPKVKESVNNKTESLIRRTNTSNFSTNSRGKLSTSNWTYKENVTIINESNIPALKKEPFVRNLDNYRAKLIWEYAAYKSPDNSIKNFSITWKEVTKTISNSPNFGEQLKKTNYFEKEIDGLITNVEAPKMKINKIYNFVKSKVKHNDFIGFYTSKGVKNAYKEGLGNVAEINLMLTAMLRYAGFNANPVILSTRSNGIPLFPNTEGFNYVIAAIENDDGTLSLLDATNQNSTTNILPEYALNWQGRIIRKNGSSNWISLNPQSPSQKVVLLSYSIDDALNIEGKILKRLTDYLALTFRDKNNEASNESQIRKLEEGKEDIEISNLTVKDKKELNKPITYNYNFKLENSVDEIDSKLYIAPLLFLSDEENPFKQESRIYPIDFIYPIHEKYIIDIAMPQGYVVESMPENKKLALNVNDGTFSYLTREKGNRLQINVEFKLNKTYILPSEYNQFKEFFALSFQKQSEQIVLVKKE